MPRARRGVRLPKEFGGAFIEEAQLGEMGIDYDDVLTLQQDERDILFKCLHEMMTQGFSTTATQLVDVDYKREPVSFERFIDDKYYLGNFTEKLRPKLREFLLDVFDSGKQFPLEIIMGGALGYGKTTVAALGMTYLVYRMGCLRNVHRFFGLMPGARIMFAIYSVSIEQAEETAYGKMDMWINNSPFFTEHMRRNPKFTARVRFHDCPVQVLCGCVAEGTLVWTPSGEVPIEFLERTGPVVLTKVPGSMATAWCSYGRVADSGLKECVELVTVEGHRLRCSLTHKVLVHGSEGDVYKAAGAIGVGENVFVLSSAPSITGPGTVQGVSAVASESQVPYRGPESEEWMEGLLDALVLGLRSSATARTNGCGPSTDQSDAGTIPGQAGDQSTDVEALQKILRRALRGTEGEEVIACCAFTAQREPASLAFIESGQTPGSAWSLDEAVSGESEGACQEVRQNTEGASDPSSGRTSTARAEKCITGDAYFYGRRVGAGVVWERVRLLWDCPIRSSCTDIGPHHSDNQGWTDDAGEYRSVVPFVQQQQARYGFTGVAEVTVGFGHGWGHEADAMLRSVVVTSVTAVGKLRTYDVVQVNNPNHSIVTNCIISSNSKEVHAIGKDIYAFILDEANFLNNKNTNAEDQGRAYDIYDGALNRLKGRFKDDTTGIVSGMVWLLSSKRTKASFLETHIKEVKADIDSGRTKLLEFSRWGVEPDKHKNKPWFRIEVGNRFHPSRILAADDDVRDGAQVVEVPESFREDAVRDIEKFLRDFAGVATDSITPLIQDASTIPRCFLAELEHPFSKPDLTIDILETDLSFDQYFLPDRMFSVRGGMYVPRRCPTAPRFIHLDFGITGDAFGLACCHISSIRSVRRERPDDGTYYDERAPVIDVDFVIQAHPLPGSEVDFSKVRAFITNLRDLGLPIWRVSMDSLYSRDTMQVLGKLQFDCVAYSVDKTDEAYLALRQAIYEKRIRFYNYPILVTELLDLQRNADEGKVDHPKISPTTGKKGTKDCADALAGAYFQAMLDKDIGPTGPGLHLDRLGDASKGLNMPRGSVSWAELDADMTKELRPWHRQ